MAPVRELIVDGRGGGQSYVHHKALQIRSNQRLEREPEQATE